MKISVKGIGQAYVLEVEGKEISMSGSFCPGDQEPDLRTTIGEAELKVYNSKTDQEIKILNDRIDNFLNMLGNNASEIGKLDRRLASFQKSTVQLGEINDEKMDRLQELYEDHDSPINRLQKKVDDHDKIITDFAKDLIRNEKKVSQNGNLVTNMNNKIFNMAEQINELDQTLLSVVNTLEHTQGEGSKRLDVLENSAVALTEDTDQINEALKILGDRMESLEMKGRVDWDTQWRGETVKNFLERIEGMVSDLNITTADHEKRTSNLEIQPNMSSSLSVIEKQIAEVKEGLKVHTHPQPMNQLDVMFMDDLNKSRDRINRRLDEIYGFVQNLEKKVDGIISGSSFK